MHAMLVACEACTGAERRYGQGSGADFWYPSMRRPAPSHTVADHADNKDIPLTKKTQESQDMSTEATLIKQHLIDPEICIRCNTC